MEENMQEENFKNQLSTIRETSRFEASFIAETLAFVDALNLG
jgi:hypothetical protein